MEDFQQRFQRFCRFQQQTQWWIFHQLQRFPETILSCARLSPAVTSVPQSKHQRKWVLFSTAWPMDKFWKRRRLCQFFLILVEPTVLFRVGRAKRFRSHIPGLPKHLNCILGFARHPWNHKRFSSFWVCYIPSGQPKIILTTDQWLLVYQQTNFDERAI